MRTKVCAAAAVALGIATGPACAAEFSHPYYTAPTYAPAGLHSYSWIGPYLGINGGHQRGHIAVNPAARPSGAAGGVYGGYNWQSGRFVIGGETDLQLSTGEDRFATWQFANPWFGTLRGRAGIALNNILLYGTGGLAYGDLRAARMGMAETRMHLGWSAGLGMEIGFTPHWSAKAEYLYVDLTNRAYVLTGTQNGLDSSLLRFGANYRF